MNFIITVSISKISSVIKELKRIEQPWQINQVLGVQKGNALKFVAGKDTVVRAFLTEEVTVDSDATSASILRDGTEVATIYPKSYDKPTKIIDFLCDDSASCGNWAAGTYVFDVTVNGVNRKEPQDGATYSYVFQERREVRILALPVKANYNGTITQVPDDKWKTMWRFTASVYPVAGDKLKWTIRDEFDASDTKYNLETDDGQRELWQALTNMMPTNCSADPQAAGCFDLIVGFISDRPNTYPEGQLQGYTYGKPANIVVAKDQDAAATVAHEIAHVYGIGDTYDGGSFRCSVNPAPNSVKGKDWDDRSKEVECTAGREKLANADGSVVNATKIPADQHPYEVNGRGALPDMACYMGSNGQQEQFWTTQEVYDHLFEQLKPATARKRQRASQRMIYYLGYVNEAGEVEIEPWESFNDTVVMTDSEGEYTIQAVDAAGQKLASRKLDIEFYINSTPPTPVTKIEWAPFEGAMLFPAGTVKFQILKGTEVLGEVPVSASAPTVSNVTPTASATISGEYTISWAAADPDGDDLTYTVEYNPDVNNAQSEWVVLTGDLDMKQWQEDFAEIPGGANAKIRVTATDGVHAASAESAVFTVPKKAPEVYIEEPEWGTSYEVGDEVLLEADVYDLQDEWLPDDKLVWTSNVSGQIIGKGTELITETLPAGVHVIILTATNSAGMTATGTITLRIGSITSDYLTTDVTADHVLTNSYSNRTFQMTIPKTLITAETYVEYESLDAVTDAKTPPAGFSFADRHFSIFAETSSGTDEWTEAGSLGGNLPVKISGLPAETALNSLYLFRWDTASESWKDVSAECPGSAYDMSTAGSVGISICNFGEFALMRSETGDFDCSGKTDLKDCIGILQTATGMSVKPANCLVQSGDVNRNGKVDIPDAIRVLQVVAE